MSSRSTSACSIRCNKICSHSPPTSAASQIRGHSNIAVSSASACTQKAVLQQPEPFSTPSPPPISAEPNCDSVAPGICLQHISLLAPMYGEGGGGVRCPDCKHLLSPCPDILPHPPMLRLQQPAFTMPRNVSSFLAHLLQLELKDLHCRHVSMLRPHLLHATIADAIVGPQKFGHILQGQTQACSKMQRATCYPMPALAWCTSSTHACPADWHGTTAQAAQACGCLSSGTAVLACRQVPVSPPPCPCPQSRQYPTAH